MTENFSKGFFALAQQAQNIALTTHIASDGDGMVSAIILQEILRQSGLSSTIITDGEDLSRYSFLMQNSQHRAFQGDEQFDLVIVLDCHSLERLGERSALLKHARSVVVMDHHVSEHNPIPADLTVIDHHFVSVGAIIYRLLEPQIKSLQPAIRKFIADGIYVTILNDTNNFSNANTTAEVFALCAELARDGMQAHLMHQAFLQNQSAQEMLYVGNSLANIKLYHHDQILFFHSDLALAARLKIDPSSLMSVIRYVQGVANLWAIAYFRELKKGVWKVSLRSLKINVQEIAAKYGGGGHRNAAGLTLKGTLSEVQDQILQDISAAIKQL